VSDAVVIALITAVSGVLVALVGARVARSTGQAAEAAQKRTDPASSAPPIPDLSDSDRDKVDGLLATVTHMAGQIGELQQDVAEAKTLAAAATSYIRRLLDYVNTHLPGRTDVPEPPVVLHDHIDP